MYTYPLQTLYQVHTWPNQGSYLSSNLCRTGNFRSACKYNLQAAPSRANSMVTTHQN